MKAKLLFVAGLCMLVAAIGLAQITLPPVPTDLDVTQTPDAVPVAKLTWTAPAGPYAFIVYRSVDDSAHFQKFALVTSPVYYDHIVRLGHTYFYYVTSVAIINSSMRPIESGPSNIDSISFATPERPLGMIAGTVTDDTTGRPIPGVRVLFYRLRASILSIDVAGAVTDSLGHYAAKLDTGTYKIKAQPAPWMPPGPPAYAPEWYDNKKDMATADPVVVIENTSVVADFGLSRPVPPPVVKGTIVGKVVDDENGLPLRGILIRFYTKGPSITNWQPTAITDSLGFYSALLDTGTYLVRADGSIRSSVMTMYQPEWFDNVADITLATPVKVAPGSTFKADFGLSKPTQPTYAYIEGTVTDTLGNVLRHATVIIMRSFQEMSVLATTATMRSAMDAETFDVDGIGYCRGVVWSGRTDSSGNFKARVLTGHAYIALAAKFGYLPEYYDNKTNPLLADIIKVSSSGVDNVDFSLTPNPVLHNSISGVVRDADGNGVPAVVALIPVNPGPLLRKMRFGHTDSTGAYTIGEVVLGTYVVMAVPFHGYAPAFYKAGTYGLIYWQLADKVLVSGDVSGIDIGVVPIQSNGFVRLSGRILAAGLPLRGVRVMATTPGGQVIGCGITEQAGEYSIEALPVGSFTLTADREDYIASDRNVTVSGDQYQITGMDFTMEPQGTTDATTGESLPATFALGQNYPNPFNPSTTITFDIPVAGDASLTIFNTLGQEVQTLLAGPRAAGRSSVVWNATDQSGRAVASGVYFYKLTVNNASGELFSSVKKMLLLR
jgi:hypothetical protein